MTLGLQHSFRFRCPYFLLLHFLSHISLPMLFQRTLSEQLEAVFELLSAASQDSRDEVPITGHLADVYRQLDVCIRLFEWLFN